jgi:4'-phosphopantetheinyl transferase
MQIVRVWHVRLDAIAQIGTDGALWLNGPERLRAAAFKFPVHRDRFVAARTALRSILGDVLDMPPDRVAFRYGAAGKPELCGKHGEQWHFNVAHSGAYGLITLTQGRRVGVDIEVIDQAYDALRDVALEFSPIEQAALNAVPREEAALAFYRCWVRKEAFVKAIGAGISVGLNRFSVSVGPGEARMIHAEPALADSRAWSLAALDGPGPEEPVYAAALAVEAGPLSIVHQNWPE